MQQLVTPDEATETGWVSVLLMHFPNQRPWRSSNPLYTQQIVGVTWSHLLILKAGWLLSDQLLVNLGGWQGMKGDRPAKSSRFLGIFDTTDTQVLVFDILLRGKGARMKTRLSSMLFLTLIAISGNCFAQRKEEVADADPAPAFRLTTFQAEAPDDATEFIPPEPLAPLGADAAKKDEEPTASKSEEPKRDFDPSQVAAGQSAFNSQCTACHDAEKSLSKRKSFNGWLSTVKRMAAKADADIPESTHAPIANYLASVAGNGGGDGGGNGKSDMFGINGFTPNATIAPLLHATASPGHNTPDFFVDAWLGADWQPGGPISASVMTCTSCHSDDNAGQAFTLEFVEASVTWDLKKTWDELTCNPCPQQSTWSAKLKGGRFIVPFGAFASMVHPAALRTVDNPLMFDMGRRFDILPYLPVLPAPYSDEGLDLSLAASLDENEKFRVTWDVYAVNGLQGDFNVSFEDSRAYRDNNRSPFTGTRLTIGNEKLRFGASLMGGWMQDQPNNDLYYSTYGFDVVAHPTDRLRFYFEYALRENSERIFDNQNTTWGVVCETEYKLCEQPRISILARYDNLIQTGYLIFPDTSVDRFTWGFNFTLPGGSQLILNHEHWVFSGDRSNAEVLAAKWVASF